MRDISALTSEGISTLHFNASLERKHRQEQRLEKSLRDKAVGEKEEEEKREKRGKSSILSSSAVDGDGIHTQALVQGPSLSSSLSQEKSKKTLRCVLRAIHILDVLIPSVAFKPLVVFNLVRAQRTAFFMSGW